MPNKDGQYIESPSIKYVNKDVIEHWKERALNSSHPILKLRYNDLIWDFSQTTVNEKPSYKHAQEAILATIELIESGYYEHVNLISQKLDRALQLAQSLNSSELVEKVKECCLDLYKKEEKETPFFINLSSSNKCNTKINPEGHSPQGFRPSGLYSCYYAKIQTT